MGKESDRVVRLLRVATEKEVIKLVVDVHADLATETPVDTGWAASNWIISMGSFSNEPVGSPENVSNVASLAGLAGVLTWSIKKGIIYITNNVPYIQRLNEGSSRKAPAGYVDMIIQRRVNEANNKVIG